MRRAVKVGSWVLASLGALVVTLGGAVWMLGNTDPGRAVIERVTDRLTSGHVRLSGLGGSLLRPTLRELTLSDAEGVWLTADDLALRWSPLKLLEGRIRGDDLRVARVHMERAPRGGGGGGPVSIPHIDVGRFSMARVELGGPLVGTPATLSLSGTLELRSLEDANADVTVRRLDGDGDYVLRAKLDPARIDASLKVLEPAGGPLANLLSLPGLGALSATMSVAGPRAALRVDLALAAGGLQAGAHGGVDLTNESADIKYSLTSPAMVPRSDVAWSKLDVSGTWLGTLSAAQADGQLAVDGLRIAGTQIRRLRADLAARAGTLALHAVVDGLEIPGPQPQLLAKNALTLDATWKLGEASRPLQLTATHSLFTLKGEVDSTLMNAAERRATVELQLPDLAKWAALVAQDLSGHATINARLTQTAGQDSVALEAAVASGATEGWVSLLGPRIALKLDGTLSPGNIDLRSARLAGNGMTLTASGSATRPANGVATGPASRVATDPAGRAAGVSEFVKELHARWQLEVLDLAVVGGGLAGDLRMAGQLSGPPTSLAGEADVKSHVSIRGSASGLVEATVRARGLPDAASLDVRAHGLVDGAALNLDAEIAQSGHDGFRLLVRQGEWNSARVEGDVTSDAALATSHGQLHVHVGELGDFDRLLGLQLSGSVEGSVEFVPARARTQVHAVFDGNKLAVGTFAGDVHLQADGPVDAVALQLTAQVPSLYGLPATAAAGATLDFDSRVLRVASADVGYRGKSFRLLSPAQLNFAKGAVVDDLAIGAEGAVFDVKGQFAPTLDLHASLLKVKPALVNVFVPDLLASGVLEARAQLEGNASSPGGNLQVDMTGVRFANDAAAGLPAIDLHARAQLEGDTATVHAELTAGAASQFTVTGSVPLNAGGVFDMKVGGNLDVGLANPLLEARGLHAAGKIVVDAAVAGGTDAPQVTGGITLGKASLRDYGRGVNLSDIEAEVVGNAAGLAIKSFTATAVSGSVGMSGTFGLLQPGMPIDLKITAKNAQPVASSIVTANLDADLHVAGRVRERIDVSGTVHVNRATIGIPNSLPPDVAVLDVRRRGKVAPAATGKALVVGIDIAIQAPQEIIVQGRGLDAELGGEIHLTGTTDELLASGGFDLQRGRYSLSGAKLEFTQGRVGFDGAGLQKKIDPTLDFTAQTTLADSTMTLRITGLADAPRFEFSSSPSMPQDEIMARLLFGENAAQLSAWQVAQIGATLATMSGVGDNGMNPLVKLQKTLGLDRLTVGTNTTTTATGATENSGAAIAAGRYISKRVYIEGKQTTTGTSQVQVDIDLTKHLKLQTRLGNGTAITQGTTPENDPGSSIGLSYQFEY